MTSTLENAPICEYEGLLEDTYGEYVKEYTLYKDYHIGTEKIKGEYKPKTKFCKYYINSYDGYFYGLDRQTEVLSEEEIKDQKYNCHIPKMKKRTCPEELERRRNAMRDKFNNNTIVNPVC
jgi:5'(3')-deoxyribonucleotidase